MPLYLQNTQGYTYASSVARPRCTAYKKEDKPWGWIFRKFPGRTQPAFPGLIELAEHRNLIILGRSQNLTLFLSRNEENQGW